MLFNSVLFWIFFTAVFLLYYSLRHRSQNKMLLVASYIFYGTWDYRFLTLIWISTIVDYFCALRIAASDRENVRKAALWTSVGSAMRWRRPERYSS